MTEPILPRIRPEIAALVPYRQGAQASPDAFKLSSNENPFEPLPSVLDALAHAMPINRYPDAAAISLRERLAVRYGVDIDQVHVSSGSVAILYQLVQAVASVGDEIIYAWRSFEAYQGMCMVAGATSVQVPLRPARGPEDGGHHDLDAMADAVTDRTRAIVLCTPNNPTGPIITSDEFAEFVARVPADVLIILDEAYIEFVTAEGAIDGLRERVFEKHPNVVVLRTFSKAYGLAGLRVGFAIGQTPILDAARSTSIPLQVTAAAETAAIASLDAEAELMQRVAVIVERRTTVVTALRAQGWAIPDSQSNFIWLPSGERTDEIAAAFAAADIVVRPFSGDGIRISVGEESSIDRVLQVAATMR